MRIERTPIKDLLVIHPQVFRDERGYFLESFNEREFHEATGGDHHFVQDNESRSNSGVLRGLHYQEMPFAQGKLVRVLAGSVLDVCVDLRPDSPTFGEHFKRVLDEKERAMIFVPPQFAHGFLVLEERTVFAYKCTAYYNPDAERSIVWNDEDLGIDWGTSSPILSEKDRQGASFRSIMNAAAR
ncbi:MAG: dTDP-4-dehydrorhamnose 3,5-epimerase [Flavobacteriales bacterium]|nr:dTDP-4-dehydrorhamnose 3,5-epimerase [Flavobacteriales bacterium]